MPRACMIHTPMNPDQPEEPDTDKLSQTAETTKNTQHVRSWLPIIQNWLSLKPADRMAYRAHALWEKLPIDFQTWSQEKRAQYLDEHHPLEEKP